MSDTNQVAVRYAAETVEGTIDDPVVFKEYPYTAAPNLTYNPDTVVSEIIRSDRQTEDLILVGASAGGDINSEMAYGIADDLLAGSLQSSWQAVAQRQRWTNVPATDQISSVAVNEFVVTDEGYAVAQGDLVRSEGFTNAGNNGFFEVDASPSNTSIPIVGSPLTVEASPPEQAKVAFVGKRAPAADIDAVASPDGLTSSAFDFTDLDLEAGDWVKLSGFDVTANDGWCRVVGTPTATSLLFDIVPTGWGADAPAGQIDIYVGSRVVNGSTKQSFTIEEEFADHSPTTYQYFTGQVPNVFTLTASAQSVVTNSVTFVGRDASLVETRTANASTEVARQFDVYNSSSDVARIAVGGSEVAGVNLPTELTLSLNNNLRELDAVGVLGAADIGSGRFEATGSLPTYFDNRDLAVDVINNAESSIDARFVDGSGHTMVLDIPRIKWSSGSPEVPGGNDDVTVNLEFTALVDRTLGYTVKFLRFEGVQ